MNCGCKQTNFDMALIIKKKSWDDVYGKREWGEGSFFFLNSNNNKMETTWHYYFTDNRLDDAFSYFFGADDQFLSFLRQVAGQLGLVETLLNLVVDEFDERVVLLGQLLLQNLVVFLANLIRSFLTHSFANDGHLPERENRFLSGPH